MGVGENLFQKVWRAHTVQTLSSGHTQLFVGLHLIHEVTSPQAFGMLQEQGLKVAMPERTLATVDHIVPTQSLARPFADSLAEEMLAALEENCRKNNIRFLNHASGAQGIVHVVGPEQGATQPGMTVVCGDSHTSTHGAFGALAFGIGTSQVRDVLATQSISMAPLQVRRIDVDGPLGAGVYAKDVILHIIRTLGIQAGAGLAYEFGGSTIDAMSMEGRMTLCNMAIEGGARIGYCNPDQTTFDYLKGRPGVPKGEAWQRALTYWQSIASDKNAAYADRVSIDARDIPPTVTWGIHPGQAAGIDQNVPTAMDCAHPNEAQALHDACSYMGLKEGQPIEGIPVQVAFIGSCTNARLSDFHEVARALKGQKVAQGVRALAVPGSMDVAQKAEADGTAQIFRDAGFEWRKPGCSMCLAMNADRLIGQELCASSSNRNFKGRQGSPTGRTVLMSPLMVAAAAVEGSVADARRVFSL